MFKSIQSDTRIVFIKEELQEGFSVARNKTQRLKRGGSRHMRAYRRAKQRQRTHGLKMPIEHCDILRVEEVLPMTVPVTFCLLDEFLPTLTQGEESNWQHTLPR